MGLHKFNFREIKGGHKLFLVLAFIIACGIIVLALQYNSETLRQASLSDLDNQIARNEVASLGIGEEIIEVYLKESDNGLAKPDYYVVRQHPNSRLDSDLPSLAGDELANSDLEIEYRPTKQTLERLTAWIVSHSIPIVGMVGLAVVIVIVVLRKKK